MNSKEMKVVFAPGAFDTFEGSQEELDELLAEIQNMFANKSKEEIEAMSRPLSEEDFLDLPESVQDTLLQSFDEEEFTDVERTRKLN